MYWWCHLWRELKTNNPKKLVILALSRFMNEPRLQSNPSAHTTHYSTDRIAWYHAWNICTYLHSNREGGYTGGGDMNDLNLVLLIHSILGHKILNWIEVKGKNISVHPVMCFLRCAPFGYFSLALKTFLFVLTKIGLRCFIGVAIYEDL